MGLASAAWSLYDPDPSCQRARFPTDSHIRRPLVHLPHKSKPAWAAVEAFVVCLFACLRIACCLLRAALSGVDPSQHIPYGYSLGVRPGYSASASAACRGQHGPAWLDILDAARPPLRPPRQAAAARQLRRARCGNVSHRHATRGAAWQP